MNASLINHTHAWTYPDGAHLDFPDSSSPMTALAYEYLVDVDSLKEITYIYGASRLGSLYATVQLTTNGDGHSVVVVKTSAAMNAAMGGDDEIKATGLTAVLDFFFGNTATSFESLQSVMDRAVLNNADVNQTVQLRWIETCDARVMVDDKAVAAMGETVYFTSTQNLKSRYCAITYTRAELANWWNGNWFRGTQVFVRASLQPALKDRLLFWDATFSDDRLILGLSTSLWRFIVLTQAANYTDRPDAIRVAALVFLLGNYAQGPSPLSLWCEKKPNSLTLLHDYLTVLEQRAVHAVKLTKPSSAAATTVT